MPPGEEEGGGGGVKVVEPIPWSEEGEELGMMEREEGGPGPP